MKKLPIGIQNIREILEEDQLYVDKTRFAKDLIEQGKHYFISRPRRFGKSLFLSTLAEICSGNKELFKGCEIYCSNYTWEKYPVVRFDFSQITSHTSKEFVESMKRALIESASVCEVSIEVPTVKEGLKSLIVQVSTRHKKKAVVLVDEYDHAIINRLGDLEIAKGNREILKDFFTMLKSLDEYLKFSFITGVSKFSQVSLFSGPNNLTDITMDPTYAGIMGYTEEELKENFQDYIQGIAKKRSKQGNLVSKKDIIEEIRTWYNGYRFSEEELSVYNPYSTLRYLSSKKAESYWYSSGTPSFLIDEAKKHPQSVVPLSGTSALKSTLSDISRLDRIHLAALMFQTGYLTIQGYNSEENSYDLGFPNKEVKEAFFNSLLQEFTEVDPLEVTRAAKGIEQDLKKLDLNAFFSKMNVHFAKMPYHVFQHAKEGFYQAVFFTFLETSGVKTMAEISTNIGRIDLMTEIPETVCIFELKLDKTAEIALTQAERKKYRERFSKSNKNTLVIGVNFSSKSRNIGDWKGMVYSSSGNVIKEILPEKGE